MASIEKRGDLQYRAVIKRQGLPRISKTFTTRKDAQAWATITESELLRGVYVSRSDSERTTLHELIERYRRDVLPGLRGKSAGPALRQLDDALGKLTLSAVTSVKVASYRDQRLHAGRAASTVKKELALLSVLFKLASREWGLECANPVSGVTRPSERGSGRTRRLVGGEEAKLLEACSPQMASIVRMALATAARLGELLSAQWDDVDARTRVLVIRGIDGRGTKNGDPDRAVPLSTEALAVLEELRALPRSVDGRLFWWWKASDSFNKSWRRATARAGIENLRFHDLRHEATSRLFERGTLGSMEVAAVTGHKTLAMLKRYTHLRATDLALKMG